MKEDAALKMIVTGGGTGGHLFPGIAVADGVLARCPGSEILFVGTDRHIDHRALASRPYKRASIACGGLKGKGAGARLQTLAQLPLSLWQAAAMIRRFKPLVVLGVGGYVTGPVVLAARLMGIATCIHEQNSVPGLANRLLGRIVDRVFLSIPGSESYFPAGKTVLTGNPVRKELLASLPSSAAAKTLLVLGGSQGAHRVNALVVEALTRHGQNLPADFRVIHQTGVADEEWVAAAYREKGIPAEVAAFFDDMAGCYRQASLVVSRAGATTLAELTVMRKPALLIPYPYAADGHQEKNAAFLENGGAARVFLEQNLDAETLASQLATVLGDGALLEQMAAQAGELAKPAATETILSECQQLVEKKDV